MADWLRARRSPDRTPDAVDSGTHEHPRHRRRHQRRPRRGRAPRRHRRRRAPPGRPPRLPDGRPRRVRRRRRWPRPPSTCARAGAWPTAARSTPSASPTSGRRPSCGTAPPASPSVPALGWQDLRTVGDCLVLQAEGIRLAPNQSATKVAPPARQGRPRPQPRPVLRHRRHLDRVAPHRGRACTSPTPPTPPSPGYGPATASGWDDHGARRRCASPRPSCPPSSTRRASSARPPRSTARRRSPGSPATSRRRSSARAACDPGQAKITFGTGGMLDVVLGPDRPALRDAGRRRHASRSWPGGRGGEITWGLEAIMLSAGTNVEWLRDDLGLIDDRRRVPRRGAGRCESTDGVVYVPALLGLGTPQWDYGARGTLLGLTRGTERPPGRAGRARGRRPAGRRPASRRPRPTPASPSPTCGSTAA